MCFGLKKLIFRPKLTKRVLNVPRGEGGGGVASLGQVPEKYQFILGASLTQLFLFVIWITMIMKMTFDVTMMKLFIHLIN